MTLIDPVEKAAAAPCTIEVDRASKDEWEFMLSEFADASVYQTWSYGVAHGGKASLSRIVVKRGQKPVGMAQARIVRLPVGGVAYISRGPAWQRKDSPPTADDLRAVLSALRDEFAVRRGLYLKVVPNLFATEHAEIAGKVFQEAGFTAQPNRYRTLLIDLTRSEDDLRAGLRQSWRKSLKKAEKAGIEIIEGTDLALYDEALAVHREMHERKAYAEFVDMEEFRTMQELLPEPLKMRIVLCKHQGEIVSAIGWAMFGLTAVPLIGATRAAALEINASYLMFWHMLVRMKEQGFRYCDLAGINPERNPGSYTFKMGMAKNNGVETTLLGEFHLCESAVSRMAFAVGNRMKDTVTGARLMLEKLKKRQSQPAAEDRTEAPSEDLSSSRILKT